ERAGGTYARLAASPLPVWGVLAGKGLACFITMIGVTTLMVGIAVATCGVTVDHPALLAAGVVCVALGFVGIMLLVATLTKTERAAQGGGWGVMMVLAFIGGAAIPSFIFPKILQQVSQISPMYWSIRAFDSGLWRDLTPGEAVLPLLVMLAIGALGFTLAAYSARRA
ncbi:MAG TPA: ABC transporter permease, partial [Phycisphaerales bacterium]|nr:ABC transporter permease [Phycisphaerales bacterium]